MKIMTLNEDNTQNNEGNTHKLKKSNKEWINRKVYDNDNDNQ